MFCVTPRFLVISVSLRPPFLFRNVFSSAIHHFLVFRPWFKFRPHKTFFFFKSFFITNTFLFFPSTRSAPPSKLSHTRSFSVHLCCVFRPWFVVPRRVFSFPLFFLQMSHVLCYVITHIEAFIKALRFCFSFIFFFSQVLFVNFLPTLIRFFFFFSTLYH